MSIIFLPKKINLYYYRKRNEEVDFIIEPKGKVIGVAVNRGAVGLTFGKNTFISNAIVKILFIENAGLPWQDFVKIEPFSLFNKIWLGKISFKKIKPIGLIWAESQQIRMANERLYSVFIA